MKRRRLDNSPLDDSDQKLAPDHHPDENFQEVIKFHRMQKGADQSWHTFYNALKAQAAKFSSRAQDELIKGRLIQSVRDKGLLALLNQLSNPSTEDVYQKCRVFEADFEVFPLIIEYLALPDIRSLSQASQKLKKIVANYLKHGNVTIDDQVIREHPIKIGADLYSFFKSATNITMDRVTERKVGKLMRLYFKNISKLTFRNMEIMDDFKTPLKSLQQLTVVDFKMENDLWLKWLKRLGPTLKELRVIRIQTHPNSDHFEFEFDSSCRNLKTLEIRGIRRVTICRGKAKSTLKSFYCDSPELRCDSMKFPCLKSLALHSWIREISFNHLQKLDYLKILEPGESLEALFKMEKNQYLPQLLKSVAIDYYKETPPDRQNLIIETLNEDCLLHVLEYLSQKDCVSIAKTNRDVYKLVIRSKLSRIDPVKDRFWRDRGYQTILWAAAPFIKELVIEWSRLMWLIPYCKQLKSLSFINQQGTAFGSEFPTNLEVFKFLEARGEVCDPHCEYGCGGNCDYVEYLSQLRGLRELTVDSSFDITACLRNNCESLEHFSVIWHIDNIHPTYTQVWDLLGSMPKLTEVTMKDSDKDDSYHFLADHTLELMLSRVGHKLLKLNIDLCNLELYGPLHCTVFRSEWLENLQELTLFKRYNLKDEDVTALCALKELRILRISKLSNNDDQIMKIIRTLPKLTVLQTQGYKNHMTFSFAKKLKETLESIGDRKLVYGTVWD